MNLARFSVQRPVFTSMLMSVIVLLGMVSWSRIPIDLMPDITYPTLSIATTYENASPEEVEELITRPIEQAVNAIPGVQSVSSTSTEGSSQVRITFSWGTSLIEAANDIRDRLDRVISRLPEQASRPMLRKFDMAAFPILILGASSKLSPLQLRYMIEDQVQHRIEQLPGVASLDVMGGVEREIQVDLYVGKMQAMGLPLNQIISVLKAENVNIPAGSMERGDLEVTIRIPGQYRDLDELKRTVVAVRDDVPIALHMIARVVDTERKRTSIVRINGQPGLRLAIQKQAGTNTVEVARLVLDEIAKINAEMPHIRLNPIIDTSIYIQRSIKNISVSVLYGGILALLILMLFLRNFRNTLVIAFSIPISIIATFALIYFGGFTLNLMTLGGLALGVGMLVDNSIVVLENIHRLRESGVAPVDAAIKGSEEISTAIVASTLTTLVVFLPLVFVRGVSGAMFKQLAYVVSFSLICSLLVALTLVPMLSARILPPAHKPEAEAASGLVAWLLKISERFFIVIERVYRWMLDKSLSHAGTVMGIVFLLLLTSLVFLPSIGVEFMPSADEGEVRVQFELEPGTQLRLTENKLLLIEKIVRDEVKEAANIEVTAGSGGGGGGGGGRARGNHSGRVRISLVPKDQRTRSSEEVATALRRKLSDIAGIKLNVRVGQGLFLLRMGSGDDSERIQIEIKGHNLATTELIAGQVQGIAERVQGVTDAVLSRDARSTLPEEVFVIDRQKAGDLKLTVSQIANMLQTVLSGTVAGYYRESGREHRILVKFRGAEQMDLNEILSLTINNSEGKPVILGNVVQTAQRRGPSSISRKNQQRIVTVSVNVSGRDVGAVISELREKLNELPRLNDVSISFGSDYEEQRRAFWELIMSLILALTLVYMVMASQYESLWDPFLVMFSVPLAIIGVIAILLLTGTTFNLQSFIGCIMLGGIAVNNAILLVDQSNQLYRHEGQPLREAVMLACTKRLRPILMTSLTTILGLLPMSIGAGEGGEAQAPLARVVIGGMLTSTFITLLFIPALYYTFYQWREKRLQK